MIPARAVVAAILVLLVAATSASSAAAAPKPFELRDGDRVVLIGDTLIEREQNYSHLETLFHLRWPDRAFTVRNLGWSGDTVFCDARSYEHAAERGFENLTRQLRELKPTVVFLGYGMADSFQGDAGLPRFRQGLQRMLDAINELDARVVMLSPIRHENLGPPLPDPAAHNRDLRKYADVIAEVAAQRGHRFIDLFALLTRVENGPPLTDNGIHLTSDGYARAAAVIAKALDVPVDASSNLAAEPIRRLAIQKNIQYFNQWRPANEPYIFGFRKHEQSRNQVELPRFTKTIEQLEAEMRTLAKQVKQS